MIVQEAYKPYSIRDGTNYRMLKMVTTWIAAKVQTLQDWEYFLHWIITRPEFWLHILMYTFININLREICYSNSHRTLYFTVFIRNCGMCANINGIAKCFFISKAVVRNLEINDVKIGLIQNKIFIYTASIVYVLKPLKVSRICLILVKNLSCISAELWIIGTQLFFFISNKTNDHVTNEKN